LPGMSFPRLEVRGSERLVERRVTARRQPLLRLACSTKCCLCHCTEPIELARPRLDLGVSTWPSRYSWWHRPPAFLRYRVHPSMSFGSPSEYVTALACSLAAAIERLPGLGLSFATSARGVHSTAGFSIPPTVRPQRFSRSRRFAPPRTSQACFIPQPRPRLLFRDFPRQPADLAHRQPVPSCRFAPLACGRVASSAPVHGAAPAGS
jgi:hypothetical protein